MKDILSIAMKFSCHLVLPADNYTFALGAGLVQTKSSIIEPLKFQHKVHTIVKIAK